MDRRIIVLN